MMMKFGGWDHGGDVQGAVSLPGRGLGSVWQFELGVLAEVLIILEVNRMDDEGWGIHDGWLVSQRRMKF